ncbi:MAG: DUF4238 domain-containing protein [Ignavibacteriaceae bacterium]
MKDESFPKKQHYVPQFILRNFAEAKSQQLYVYDKQDEKEYKTNIRNIAAEKGFYDIEFKDIKLSIELSLSQLESKATELINNIIKGSSIKNLSDNDKKFCLYSLLFKKIV